MLHRMVMAGLLALGTGMAWSDPPVGGDTDVFPIAADFAFVPFLYGERRTESSWLSVHTVAQPDDTHRAGERLLDKDLLFGWASATGVSVEAGYRNYRLNLVDYDQFDRLEVDMSGPYATFALHF